MPIRSKAGHVSRLVEAGARLGAERIRHELQRRQVGLVHITARQPRAADVKLAGSSDRRRPQFVVENVDLGVVNRPTDARRPVTALVREYRPGGRDDCALGRAIIVHEKKGQRRRRIGVERVGAGQHHPQGALRGPRHGHHALGHRGRYEGDRDLLRDEPVPECLGVVPPGLVGKVDARPRGEVGPEFPDGGVESHRGDLGGPVGGRDLEDTSMPKHEIQEARVCDLHSLGLAGGPRGIDDVGEVLHPDV